MSRAPLVVVTGTGTEIGKTHVSVALLEAWAAIFRARDRATASVAGIKPVESGVVNGLAPDGSALERASTFHVKRFPSPYMLARAVSPHLAARDEGRTIERGIIAAHVRAVRDAADGVLVELAGGLFSPLAAGVTNAEVALDLEPDLLLLVAPDRLGVLHDVGAAARAARALGLAIGAIVLVTPAERDASTGTNAAELAIVTDIPVAAIIAREAPGATAARPELAALLRPYA